MTAQENFQKFTESFGFVIFFLAGTLMFNMLLGDQVTFWFLLLVLLGMVFSNVGKFTELLGRYSKA